MPYRDGTGPCGEGPLTGRGFGPCGRGRGLKQGFRRGFGRRFFQPIELSKDEQKKILKEELEELEAEKKAIAKKLKEVE